MSLLHHYKLFYYIIVSIAKICYIALSVWILFTSNIKYFKLRYTCYCSVNYHNLYKMVQVCLPLPKRIFPQFFNNDSFSDFTTIFIYAWFFLFVLVLYSFRFLSINLLYKTNSIFKIEPIVSEISKQTNSSALQNCMNIYKFMLRILNFLNSECQTLILLYCM